MNVDMEDNRARLPRYFTLEMLMSVMVALSGLVLIWNLVSPVVSVLALFIAGMVFTLSITVLIRLFGSSAEGVSYSIILMNILSPQIDRLTRHRVFGGGK